MRTCGQINIPQTRRSAGLFSCHIKSPRVCHPLHFSPEAAIFPPDMIKTSPAGTQDSSRSAVTSAAAQSNPDRLEMRFWSRERWRALIRHGVALAVTRLLQTRAGSASLVMERTCDHSRILFEGIRPALQGCCHSAHPLPVRVRHGYISPPTPRPLMGRMKAVDWAFVASLLQPVRAEY